MLPTEPDALIVFPPQWTPQNPPFALASLGGHLRSCGWKVRLVDLNLAYYEQILQPDSLRHCGQLARSRVEHLRSKCQMRLLVGQEGPQAQLDARHLLALEELLERPADPWEEAALKVEDHLKCLRDPERFYEPACLLPALVGLDRALELAIAPYAPAHLALNDFRNPRYPLTLEGMKKATLDSWGNPFLSWMRERVGQLVAQKPALLAISISSFSQVLAGLTLARLLKQAAPEIPLTLGGNFFGRVADRLFAQKEFFGLYCDSLVVGEGEVTLEHLLRAVRQGKPVDGMAGVVTAAARGPSARSRDSRLEEVGPLDLADLPLERYFSPEPVVCIQASRGCYWGQCSFCDSYWGVTLDKKSTPRLIRELRHLKEQYGVRHFEFIDECLPPEEMATMASAIRESGLNIHWFANGRTESGFLSVLPELPAAGLSMLLWGVESGSDRILKLLAKGVHPQKRWPVLRKSAEVGIWNFAYVFFGFPGETAEEARQTIDMICHNTDLLHSYGRSVYTLGRHSPIASDPKAYGLSDLVEEGTDLSVNLTYKNPAGPNPEELQSRLGECTRRCREAYGDPLWMVLRNRENLHLYLVRYGSKKVQNWSLQQEWVDSLSFQK